MEDSTNSIVEERVEHMVTPAEEMEDIQEELNNARKDITRTASGKANQTQWMKKFMDSGSPVEHEAFLAFWLSRKVLTNSDGAKFHRDKANGISDDSSLDDELLSFARCIRPSELVGLDCIEQYLPHRVALQFGMDQDIPGTVSRSNDSSGSAWADYNKSVWGGKLNIPSRVFEAGVTTRYLKWWNGWWWNRSLLSMPEASKDALEDKRSFKIKRKGTEEMNKSDCFTSFKMIPKGLKRAKEGDGNFKMTPKKLKGMRNSNAFPGPKGLKRSRLLSNQKEKGKKATSDLGSSRKRLKKLVDIPDRKREVHTAQSSKAKKKAVLRPHESPPKGSEVSNEDKNGANSDARLSSASKELPPRFVTKIELNNSPFPPGFSPKPNHVQAKVSTEDDMVTPALPPRFPPKCSDEDEVTLAAAPPGFPPKGLNEDEITPKGIDADEVILAAPPVDSSKGINENYEVTPAASLAFSPTCIGEDKDESTIVEVSDSVNEVEESVDGDKLTATEVLNLSEDSITDDEDQLTISEVLKLHRRSENVEYSNAREGKNSSGHCQNSSFSIADKVPKPLVGMGNAIPTMAASGGSNRATIEDKTESCGGRSNGIPGDKAAVATVNCVEEDGNGKSDEVETDVPLLERRIGRLEILVAYMKATRKVKGDI
ncbi:hypothetical protein CCACVL1_00095 [Corchorus capsularis]|uniref:Aminotransferase-like plant mobile domain-containing protein n=1 Tax=Corchorus capsularis TaxID=210143 RepID=A0A1R3KYJ2_COCAP|nr:hypothetical protein CCACVL1_00095 [Corchorus capsularis]